MCAWGLWRFLISTDLGQLWVVLLHRCVLCHQLSGVELLVVPGVGLPVGKLCRVWGLLGAGGLGAPGPCCLPDAQLANELSAVVVSLDWCCYSEGGELSLFPDTSFLSSMCLGCKRGLQLFSTLLETLVFWG